MVGSESSGAAPPEEVPPVLRFCCPHCRAELTAPLAAAGVVGPCPLCGEDAQAPAEPVEDPPVEPARQESPEPRPLQEKPAGQRRVRKRRRRTASRKGSMDVTVGAGERRERRALIKFLIALLVTIAVTLGVCWVVWARMMSGGG